MNNKQGEEFWEYQVQPLLLMENLGKHMYGGNEQLIWELVRNGAVACMRDADKLWEPHKIKLEIKLVENHPLSPGSKCLIILDHGKGFTQPNIVRFCQIGPSFERRQSVNGNGIGASQKGIGRFAAFGLNRKIAVENDYSANFYILTRTQSEGQVRLVTANGNNSKGVRANFVDSDGVEMSHLEGIKGSFTAILIPDSVVTSYDEIRKALLNRLPRKKNLLWEVVIDGKKLIPPSLENRVTHKQQNGGIEVYIDVIEEKTSDEGGLWLSDALTGTRVVHTSQLGYRYLPDPFWHRTLKGEIFIPNLLRNQNTSRVGLTTEFLKSAEWRQTTSYLSLHVKEAVESLLSTEVAFGNDPLSRTLDEIIDVCNDVFGPPDLPQQKLEENHWEEEPIKKKTGITTTRKSQPTTRVRTNNHRNKTSQPRINAKYIKVDGKTFALARRAMHSAILADTEEGQTIYINHPDQYMGMPTRKDARAEHVLTQILEAVALLDTSDARDMRIRTGQLREKLLKGKS